MTALIDQRPVEVVLTSSLTKAGRHRPEITQDAEIAQT